MKRIISLFLLLCIGFIMSSCSTDTTTNDTTETTITENEDLGIVVPDQDTETEEPVIDYSDLGFDYNYGMDTYLSIEGYHFDHYNSNKSYVRVKADSGYNTYQFRNNYKKTIYWNDQDCNYDIYDENDSSSIGHSYTPQKFDLVDNDTIIYRDGLREGTITITDRKMVNGVPILITKNVFSGSYYGEDWLLPTDFIDWSRSPVRKTTSKHGEIIKYYINPDCIQLY
ncbi:MAG: hypothetical protein ACI4HO_01500 [Ruminococcus sp.]